MIKKVCAVTARASVSVSQLSFNTATVKYQHSSHPTPLYPTHIPTSSFQKMILGVGSAAVALSDPWRADMVAVNGEVTGLPALKFMHSKMEDDKEGSRILSDCPRITSSILTELSNLHNNTLGHQYAAFMEKHKISPDSRSEVN